MEESSGKATSKPAGAKDRRKFVRLVQNVVTKLTAAPGTAAEGAEIRIIELSAAGVGFECAVEFQKGQEVAFEFPPERPVRVGVKIVRVQPRGKRFLYGTVYQDTLLSDHHVVKTFLAKQMKEHGVEPAAWDDPAGSFEDEA